MLAQALRRSTGQFCSLDAASSWQHAYSSSGYEKLVCEDCYAMLKRRDWQQGKATWQQLPELLGIQVAGWAQEAVPEAQAA